MWKKRRYCCSCRNFLWSILMIITVITSLALSPLLFVCLFSWHYNPLWLYFHSPVMGFSLLVFEVSWSHNDVPQSVGLLWTTDQYIAETSTWQHRTLTRQISMPGGIRTHNLSRRAAEDLCLRPRGYWDRHFHHHYHHQNLHHHTFDHFTFLLSLFLFRYVHFDGPWVV